MWIDCLMFVAIWSSICRAFQRQSTKPNKNLLNWLKKYRTSNFQSNMSFQLSYIFWNAGVVGKTQKGLAIKVPKAVENYIHQIVLFENAKSIDNFSQSPLRSSIAIGWALVLAEGDIRFHFSSLSIYSKSKLAIILRLHFFVQVHFVLNFRKFIQFNLRKNQWYVWKGVNEYMKAAVLHCTVRIYGSNLLLSCLHLNYIFHFSLPLKISLEYEKSNGKWLCFLSTLLLAC